MLSWNSECNCVSLWERDEFFLFLFSFQVYPGQWGGSVVWPTKKWEYIRFEGFVKWNTVWRVRGGVGLMIIRLLVIVIALMLKWTHVGSVWNRTPTLWTWIIKWKKDCKWNTLFLCQLSGLATNLKNFIWAAKNVIIVREYQRKSCMHYPIKKTKKKRKFSPKGNLQRFGFVQRQNVLKYYSS